MGQGLPFKWTNLLQSPKSSRINRKYYTESNEYNIVIYIKVKKQENNKIFEK